MPDVRMPDGTIIRNVPEGTTKAELQRKLAAHSQPAAKPKSWGENLWQSTKNAAAGAVEFAAAVPDAATDAMAGAMRYGAQGVDAVGGAGLRAIGADGAADSLHRGAQMADKAWSAPAKIGNIGAKIAPEPTDTAGKVARFGAGMIATAGLGAAASKAPTAIRTMLGAPPTPPIPRNALAQAAGRNTAGQQLIADGQRVGGRVMTSDALPPKTFVGKSVQAVGERIPVLGTGGQRAAQQGERVEAVRNIAREYGAASGDDLTSPAIDGVMADFAKTRGAAVARYAKAKTAVIDGTVGVVPVGNTMRALDAEIARLGKVGTDASQAVVAKLQNWKSALQGKDLPTIDLIRAEMGQAFKDPSLASIKTAGEKSLQSIYGPMKADMGEFIKTAGGPDKLAQWNKANLVLSGMANELKVSTLKSVLRTGEGSPEDVAKILFSNKPSLVRRLYAGLSNDGKVKAQAAIMHRAIEKSGGMETASPEKFITQMTALGKSTGVFFQGDDLARVNGLVRYLKGTARAGQAGVMTNSGQQAVPFLVGGAAATHPLLVGGGALIARAYESAPVRNLLVGLAKTQPGSKAEAAILKRIAAPMAVIISRESEALSKAANSNVYAPLAASQGSSGDQQQQDQPAPQP